MAAALLAAVPAAAQERSIWALVVNEEPKGDIEIVLTPRDPGSIPRRSPPACADCRTVSGGVRAGHHARVSLASLAPRSRFKLDEAEIRLLLSADPSLLSDTAGDLQSAPARMDRQLQQRGLPELLRRPGPPTASGTATASSDFHLFGGLFESAASVNDAGEVTPGLTSLTIDQVRHRRRWVFGDTIGRSTTLGSAPMVGGFSLSTQTSVDPYYTLYPSPQVRGAVRTPTTADLYVDGRLVSSVRLPPGQFTLNDLPLETGLGNARVILRDAFGREQTINLGFYLSTQLLKRGEQDYSYSRRAGANGLGHDRRSTAARWARPSMPSASPTGSPSASRRKARRISRWAAPRSTRAVAAGHVRPRRAGQPGPHRRTAGYAATGVYQFFSHLVSGDLRATWVGPRFRNLFLEPADQRQVTADGSISTSLGWLGSLTVGATLGGPDAFSARTTQVDAGFPRKRPDAGADRAADTLVSQHDVSCAWPIRRT